MSNFSGQLQGPSSRSGAWALKSLTRAVNKIGIVQGEQVDGLKRTIDKVKLDKQILLKEKLEAIWRDQSYDKTGPYDIKSDLRVMKQERHLTNLI